MRNPVRFPHSIEPLVAFVEDTDPADIIEQTYRRLLREPEKVRMETRRQVLEALGLSSPHYVRELAPNPSPEMVTDVLAAYAEANREGWVAYDPETLEPTGEVFDGAGKLLRTYDPKAS